MMIAWCRDCWVASGGDGSAGLVVGPSRCGATGRVSAGPTVRFLRGPPAHTQRVSVQCERGGDAIALDLLINAMDLSLPSSCAPQERVHHRAAQVRPLRPPRPPLLLALGNTSTSSPIWSSCATPLARSPPCWLPFLCPDHAAPSPHGAVPKTPRRDLAANR